MGLWARFGFGAINVAAGRRDYSNQFVKLRRCLQNFAIVNNRVNRAPVARRKHQFAVGFEVFAADIAQVHHAPRNDRIHGHAIQRARQFSEQTTFDAAARFQRAEIDLSVPIILPQSEYSDDCRKFDSSWWFSFLSASWGAGFGRV